MRCVAFTFVFLTSFSAMAAAKSYPIIPNIFNYGNALQVQIINTTPTPVFCSGNITAYLNNGQIQSFYMYEAIPKGGIAQRYYPVTVPGVRITNHFHSIFCNPR